MKFAVAFALSHDKSSLLCKCTINVGQGDLITWFGSTQSCLTCTTSTATNDTNCHKLNMSKQFTGNVLTLVLTFS